METQKLNMFRTAATCLLSMAIQTAGNTMSLGIIWHEQNAPEVKRTLINRLISNNCAVSMVFNALVMNTSNVMILYGAMNVYVCDVVSALLQAVMLGYLLNANVIVVLRNGPRTNFIATPPLFRLSISQL